MPRPTLLSSIAVDGTRKATVVVKLTIRLFRYPTAGGQYHWVAALAPPNSRRFLSFFCCCILTFTWLSFLSAATWLFGMDITAIVLIHTGEYSTKYTFAAALCIQVISCVVNITWVRTSPFLQMSVVAQLGENLNWYTKHASVLPHAAASLDYRSLTYSDTFRAST